MAEEAAAEEDEEAGEVGAVLLLIRSGPAPAPQGLDVSLWMLALLPALHATSFETLDFWTEAQLYEQAEEILRRAATKTPLFVDRVSIGSVTALQPSYELPARHVATLQVSLDEASLQPLTVPDAEALSSSWPDEEGPASHWMGDAEPGRLRLFPIPDAGGTLYALLARFPTVSAGQPVVRAPRALSVWLCAELLTALRGQSGPAAMPEVAAWCQRVSGVFTSAAMEHWG